MTGRTCPAAARYMICSAQAHHMRPIVEELLNTDHLHTPAARLRGIDPRDIAVEAPCIEKRPPRAVTSNAARPIRPPTPSNTTCGPAPLSPRAPDRSSPVRSSRPTASAPNAGPPRASAIRERPPTDPRTHRAGELHQQAADSTCRRLDQDPVTPTDPGVFGQSLRRTAIAVKRDGLRQADALRHREQRIGQSPPPARRNRRVSPVPATTRRPSQAESTCAPTSLTDPATRHPARNGNRGRSCHLSVPCAVVREAHRRARLTSTG